MFCFQCQQTAKNTACTVKGVCGKNEAVSNLQDRLVGKLAALAKVSYVNNDSEADNLVIFWLFVTVINVNFRHDTVSVWFASVDNMLSNYLAHR